MSKCEKCNSEFKIPRFAIDRVLASYCMPCLKKMFKENPDKDFEKTVKRNAKKFLK